MSSPQDPTDSGNTSRNDASVPASSSTRPGIGPKFMSLADAMRLLGGVEGGRSGESRTDAPKGGQARDRAPSGGVPAQTTDGEPAGSNSDSHVCEPSCLHDLRAIILRKMITADFKSRCSSHEGFASMSAADRKTVMDTEYKGVMEDWFGNGGPDDDDEPEKKEAVPGEA